MIVSGGTSCWLVLILLACLHHWEEANGWIPKKSTLPRSSNIDRIIRRTTTSTAFSAAAANLAEELTTHGLGLCHGVFHASGVRQLSDLQHLTELQMDEIGIDKWDRRCVVQLKQKIGEGRNTTCDDNKPISLLSTNAKGAFHPVQELEHLQDDPSLRHDFGFETLAPGIFKGRMFTIEQCTQLSRMAEYYAYRGIGTFGAGWTSTHYTLTAQHMLCKDIPDMNAATRPRFQQLFTELYQLYPGRLVEDSISFDGEDEPHLVKYHGNKAKGTALHRDNSKFVYVTVNVALSSPDDFSGGGTYIESMNETISLQQGEMLIHLGDMLHSGVDITSGVRNLMIAFLACEWHTAPTPIEPI